MELPIKNTLSGPAFLSRLCQKGERWYRQQIINLSCCDLCGLQCRGFPLLCNSCFDDLPIFYVDKTAGDLLNWPAINKALPNINFDHLICLSPYVAPFDHWLNQFKYQGRFELGDLFAQLLAQYWKNNHLMFLGDPPDLVLAVPLHIDKWKIRGYNQAHLIARSLAKKISLPYNNQLLIRNKMTSSQVGKTGVLRRKNLVNAFTVVSMGKFLPKHVLLVDDVVTTGSTASAISQALKQAGVMKVTVLALCLALPTTNM